MKEPRSARLVLADGTCFEGVAFGAEGSTTGEAVFTTGMTGYQEVLSDPSYCNQIVTMTAPQIGNTGINAEDAEARRAALSGFVLHEASPVFSNWRAKESLEGYLTRSGVVALARVDTRALTTHIRDQGAQMAAIGSESRATLHDRAKAAAPMEGRNLTLEVTTREPYEWTQDSGAWAPHRTAERDAKANAGSHGARTGSPDARVGQRHVVAIDFGVKLNILRCLADAGCRVTVVPATTSAEAVLGLNPDGVFLSNGPGDPAAVTDGIETVRELLGKRPIFGICLGQQILALALGGRSYKLKFGHHGLNQPVKDIETGRIEITTQNHGFAVDVESLSGRCELTHVNLNDDTCEGVWHRDSGAFGVQYHPEAAAGPHDSRYLFDRFVDRLDQTDA